MPIEEEGVKKILNSWGNILNNESRFWISTHANILSIKLMVDATGEEQDVFMGISRNKIAEERKKVFLKIAYEAALKFFQWMTVLDKNTITLNDFDYETPVTVPFENYLLDDEDSGIKCTIELMHHFSSDRTTIGVRFWLIPKEHLIYKFGSIEKLNNEIRDRMEINSKRARFNDIGDKINQGEGRMSEQEFIKRKLENQEQVIEHLDEKINNLIEEFESIKYFCLNEIKLLNPGVDVSEWAK